MARAPILRRSFFTRAVRRQPKWTLTKPSSPRHRIHGGTESRLPLSHAVLSKGDLKVSSCRPPLFFPLQRLYSERGFQLPTPAKRETRDARREASLPPHAPPPSPAPLLLAPPPPSGGWRSGKATWRLEKPREALRSFLSKSPHSPLGPRDSHPAPCARPLPLGPRAQRQPPAALGSAPPTWRDAGGDYLRAD